MSLLELASCGGGRVGDKQEASWIADIFFFRLGIRWSHIVKDWKKDIKASRVCSVLFLLAKNTSLELLVPPRLIC